MWKETVSVRAGGEIEFKKKWQPDNLTNRDVNFYS